MKLKFYLMSYTKTNSKWIKELNYKILRRNMEESFMTFHVAVIS